MHLQTILYKYNNKYFKHIFDEHQQTQRDDQNKDRKYFWPPRKIEYHKALILSVFLELYVINLCCPPGYY